MKILKYLLYLIIGLVIITIALGFAKPWVDYGHEITTNKSHKEAWAVTQDESKYKQWLEGFKSIELISGDAKALGSKYKVVVNPGEGQPDFEMVQTLVALKEFDHVELHFDSDFMDFEQIISFKETSDGSTVKTDSKVKGKNIFMHSMFVLMEMLGGSFTAQETKNMEALKKLINENTTDYYPVPETSMEEAMVPEEASN